MTLTRRVDRLEKDQDRAELVAIDRAIGRLTPAERQAWAVALERDLAGEPIPGEVGSLADQAAGHFAALMGGGERKVDNNATTKDWS